MRAAAQRKESWLARQPALLTKRLAAHNVLHRFVLTRRGATLALCALAAIALVIWLASAFGDQLDSLIQAGVAYIGFFPIVAALHAAMLVARRRHQLRARQQESWLIATARGFATSRHTVVIETCASVMAHALTIAVVLAALGLLSHSAFAGAMQLLAYALGGLLPGAVVGWFLPSMRKQASNEASRYVPKPASHAGVRLEAAALAGWPIAQTFAWNRPENLRIVILVALLSVQAGSSMVGGLSVVAAWLIGAYLTGLLRAIGSVGREAAQWLRSTPISFANFAWSVARRALLHQFIGTLVGAGVISVLGSPLSMTLYLAGLWLTIVIVVSAVSLADSYRGRSPAIKLVLSFAAMAGIESRAHGWAIPFALGFAAWNLRAGASMRARS